MVAELRAAVQGGDYSSVSEVVRDWRLRRKVETLKVEELRVQGWLGRPCPWCRTWLTRRSTASARRRWE